MSGLARAIAVLGAVSVIGTVTQVAKGKMGAVLFGPEGVGILNQLTSFYGMVMILGGLGFYNGVIRRLTPAQKEGRFQDVLAQVNSVSIFLGLLSLILVIIFAWQAEPVSDFLFEDGGERAGLVRIILAAVPFVIQQNIFRAYLNSRFNLKAIANTQLISDISSVFLYALLAWQFDLEGAVIAFAAMHMILFVCRAWHVWKLGGIKLLTPTVHRFRWSEIRVNIGYGINGLIRTSVATGSVLLVGKMIIIHGGLHDNGIFAVAWKVSTLYLGAIYASVGNYYFPTLVSTNDNIQLQKEVSRAVTLYMTVLPPCMAGLIIFGDWLIPLLFDSEFLPVVKIMSILIFGDIFRVSSENIGLTLLARNRLVLFTGSDIVFFIGFMACSWFSLPQYGLLGVAVSYLTMHFVKLLIIIAVTRQVLQLKLPWNAVATQLQAILWIAPLVYLEINDYDLVTKLAVGIAIGLLWLVAQYQRKEFRSDLAKAFQKLGLKKRITR